MVRTLRLDNSAEPGDSASHARGMANGDAEGAERATGAVISSGGLSEFSRMLSVFINCSKLKVSSCSASPMEMAAHMISLLHMAVV